MLETIVGAKHMVSVHHAGPHDDKIALGVDRLDFDEETGVTAYLDLDDAHALIDALQKAIGATNQAAAARALPPA
ncbi:hypothetical protein [Rhodococcus ruber]|uniref:hypothetical protein n=1 Tax=Rhodococcus ruber TaxID=1830 RepID=UPI003D816192